MKALLLCKQKRRQSSATTPRKFQSLSAFTAVMESCTKDTQAEWVSAKKLA